MRSAEEVLRLGMRCAAVVVALVGVFLRVWAERAAVLVALELFFLRVDVGVVR